MHGLKENKQANASTQQPTEGDKQIALVVRKTDSEPIPTDDILMHDKGEGDRAKVCAIVPFKDTAEKDKNPFDQHLGTEYVLKFVSEKSKLTFVAEPSSTKVVGKNPCFEKSINEKRVNVLNCISTLVTDAINKKLEAPFLVEEVLTALQMLPKHSCLGDVGLSPLFFSEFWDIIGDDILQALQ